MLGKKRNDQEVDNFFMEEAWKDMAAQLDEVMPVEKEGKSRGWIMIAATLLIGFAAGLSVMWGLQHQAVVPIAKTTTVAPEVETTGTTSLAATSLTNQEIEAKLPIQNKNATIVANAHSPAVKKSNTLNNTVAEKTIIATSANTPSVFTQEDALAQSTENLLEKGKSTVFVVKENKKLQVTFAAENINDIAASISSKAQLINPAIAATIALDHLPLVEPSLVSATETAYLASPMMVLPRDRKWNMGGYVGVTGINKFANGLEASARVERKLGAKWALQSGIGYQVTNLNVLTGRNDNSSADQAFSGSDPESVLNPEFSEAYQLADQNSTQQQLLLPATVVFKATGKLRFMLSMNWAFRLNDIPDSDYDYLDGNLSPREERFNNTSKSNYNSFTGRFSKSSLGFGVGYYFNPKTGIEFSYNRRFGSDVNTLSALIDKGGEYGHYFRLGVARYL